MRGLKLTIADRFDLTLECVRRHYLGQMSPLSAVLDANADFFGLFRDFGGFVDFFLLQDLVSEGGRGIRFMITFDDFAGSGLPGDVDTYMDYLNNARVFIKARNNRISALDVHV